MTKDTTGAKPDRRPEWQRRGWERSEVDPMDYGLRGPGKTPADGPPADSWTRRVPRGTLKVQRWGEGTEAGPWVLTVSLIPDPGTTSAQLTLQDMREALALFLPDGSIMQAPPVLVRTEDALADLDEGGGAMAFAQVGTAGGTDADRQRKERIIRPTGGIIT